MSDKEKLISFLHEENEKMVDLIKSKLKDDEIFFAIEYLEKLNSVSKHRIKAIGHSDDGDFFVKCETGITYLK
ncbi:hypothetical protein AB9T89_01210 [Flavobacterium oncorhynchi]|uniref:hypothetical protein n=1 Tax=Flavobacterium oncorhynchi TaxID=728056 RepID=UPI00351A580D